MTDRDASVGAAVDVGSNSVHLLVGRLATDHIEPLRDESMLLGLGDVVDREGYLTAEARAATIETLLRFRGTARAFGAELVTLLGTEPLRRATNGALLCDEVEAATGLPLHVLSERREAELTYLGVTGGRTPKESLLVVDIGGGSTELVVSSPGHPLLSQGLPTGSGRLSTGIVTSDPPSMAEIDRLRVAALQLASPLPRMTVARAVFVGGTATNLCRLAPLDRDGLAEAYRVLANVPAAIIVKKYRVNLRRAGQLAAGAALAEAILEHFAPAVVEVSQSSLRDGAILVAARLGGRWPDRLVEMLPV